MERITDAFRCRSDCPTCRGEGHVCEAHPDRPWYPVVAVADGGCDCGAPGMPCGGD